MYISRHPCATVVDHHVTAPRRVVSGNVPTDIVGEMFVIVDPSATVLSQETHSNGKPSYNKTHQRYHMKGPSYSWDSFTPLRAMVMYR